MPYVGDKLPSLFGDRPQAELKITLRRMAERAGDRMVQLTVTNTPIYHGNLRSSWYQLPANKTFYGPWEAYESGVATNVDYAPHVEYGTGLWGPKGAKYPIFPKTPGGYLRWLGPSGKPVFARRVMHPGSPGQHMVAIAADVVEHEFDSGILGDDILNEWIRTVEAGAH